jgi:hypothetical protein
MEFVISTYNFSYITRSMVCTQVLIGANGSGIGDARIVETLNYKQAVQYCV